MQNSMTAINDFIDITEVSDVQDKTRLSEEIAKVKKIGAWVLGLGLGGFIAFASFVPLDEGVPTQGVVTIDTKRKVIQHLFGGIVSEVLVREGQQVQDSEPLIRLNDSSVKANFEAVRQQYFNLKIIESRLLAEQEGGLTILFDPEIKLLSNQDKQLAKQMGQQTQLLLARRKSMDTSISALKESAAGQKSIYESTILVDQNRQMQLQSLEGELKGVKELVAQGFFAVNKKNEMERTIADVKSQIADNIANQLRAKQSILEIEQRQTSVRADFIKEVEQSLSQIRPEIQTQTERFNAIKQELDRTEIRSPVAGQVVGLSVQNVGAVIQAGQRIMDIVPTEEELILETKIAPQLIDKIKPGDKVDVRFSSFADTPQLVVPGVLSTVSKDVLTESTQNPVPYYLARVAVTKEGLVQLGSKKMQPGMAVEVVIKTGSRTLLQYLVSPLSKRIAASLKEQ